MYGLCTWCNTSTSAVAQLRNVESSSSHYAMRPRRLAPGRVSATGTTVEGTPDL